MYIGSIFEYDYSLIFYRHDNASRKIKLEKRCVNFIKFSFIQRIIIVILTL